MTYACPACRVPLRSNDGRLRCPTCSHVFVKRDGIAILAFEIASQASEQASFFDTSLAPEWEIERPYGAPRFHNHVIRSKFRRSIGGLGDFSRAGSALVVCGGSGMDAGFLAEQGFSVATTDISSGASLRALERSRRFGFPLRVVVADAERLPFPNRSFDLVYVHDGLHHLEQPYVGLDEMLRVARSAVSINEPAAAAVTRAAAVIGVAENVEEAGNHVKRMSLDAIQARCDEAGFDVVQARRYAMFYRHEPGLPMRVLSKPILFTAARVGSSVVNRFVGRIGNKLTVQAVRRA